MAETDREIDRLRGGDEEAWCDAYSILLPMARRVAQSSLPKLQDAEEVGMKTLEEIVNPGILDKIKTFDDLKNLKRTIAKRRAIDEIRRKMAEKR